MNTKKVIINGNNIELENVFNVSDLIAERSITGTMFVVEINLKIVNKEDYHTTLIEDGDSIEIVGFFGGG